MGALLDFLVGFVAHHGQQRVIVQEVVHGVFFPLVPLFFYFYCFLDDGDELIDAPNVER